MKKELQILILISCLLFSVGMVNAKTESKEKKVIFKEEKITDKEILEKRMDEGITDDSEFSADCILSEEIIEDQNGKKYKIKVKSVKQTSQKLEEVEYENGQSASKYCANIISEVEVEPLISKVASSENVESFIRVASTESVYTLLASGGTDLIWDYDNSGYNAKLYVEVEYVYGTMDSYPAYKMESLKGKVDIFDTSVSATKLTLTQNCLGVTYESLDENDIVGQAKYDKSQVKQNPSDNVWYSHTNLSPYYWNLADQFTPYIKGTTKIDFSRGGSSWSASIVWSR